MAAISHLGFRNMSISEQISTLQTCLFPIVLLQLSRDFELRTGRYNYFNMSDFEQAKIIDLFPPFCHLLEPFKLVGVAVKEMQMTELEMAFLSAIHIMNEGA